MNVAGYNGFAAVRVLICRTLAGCMLLFVLWRWYAGLLPHQWLQPPLVAKNYDITQWLFRLTGLDALLVKSPGGAGWFSGLLLGFGALSFAFPLQRRFTWPFVLLFFCYALAFNMYLMHNSHYLSGAVWLSLCLLPKRDTTFATLWEGARYYVCFAYGTAFIWKLWGGAFLQWENGFLAAKSTLVEHLYFHPGSALGEFQRWCLQHPFLLNAGQKITALAEGAFLIGFFTKKTDKILIILILLIHIATFLFADVLFIELAIVFILPLISSGCWQVVNKALTPRSVRDLL